MSPGTGIIPCPLRWFGEQKIFVTVVNCLMRLMGRCDEILRVEQNVCPFQKISLPNRVQMVNDDSTKYLVTFDAEVAARVALEKGMTLVRLPAGRYSCDRVRSADFSECFQFGLDKIDAASGPVLLADQWEPASTPHAFVLEAQAFVG